MNNLIKFRYSTVRSSWSICVRQLNSFGFLHNKHELKQTTSSRTDLLLEKYKNVLLYVGSSTHNVPNLGYVHNKQSQLKIKRVEKALEYKAQRLEPLPLSLKYLTDNTDAEDERTSDTKQDQEEDPDTLPTHFPFQTNLTEVKEYSPNKDTSNTNIVDLDLEVRTRWELYNKPSSHHDWMQDYENFSQIAEDDESGDEWKINYGTPDPLCRPSSVPCGGCGALLHCKEPSIPGYIPSEIFKNYREVGGADLKTMTCQRCHFLKNYEMALQVRVRADDYPKVLTTIATRKKALVVLMVDLLDFPCSIWPGIPDLIGQNRQIVVVGNKVDLLPQDGKGYLKRVQKNLMNSVREAGFGMTNIKHVALISATTGFGVEDLITKLHDIWQYKGDVFLVGCTNVGKSSLFNAMLQSDYCKYQATDLIQRATTSPWPGTTLNLLKFPVQRPTGWRLYVRSQRLSATKKLESEENRLREIQMKATRDPKYATLIGHIGTTFSKTDRDEEDVDESRDVFSVAGNGRSTGKVAFGVNESHPDYATCKWCYDTPGVVQPDQIIHLLTTEELVLTLPKNLIRPKTFSLHPGATIFIAGLGRLDFLEGPDSTRFTVFCARTLPITICKTSEADKIYKDFLTTEMLAVPKNYPDRLQHWPGLEASNNFTVTGIDKNTSCGDLVLSNAGWVSITPECGERCTVQGWTPERRGIHLRDSLLPKAVALRGKKVRGSCAYGMNHLYINR